ncbi:MAG: ribbon-helix-helix protein, CopG family [Chloroflexota bacterium]|nr:ribbon-helix-helix protein, CopG family [Chloroflexota bacterium]MDE2685630.1 ribbon-helix-helix protein, CopG family [Chloroflexota bacterium]
MPPRRISRTITFSLPPEMFQEVQRVKDEEGRDMSELVREALRLYMEDLELRHEQRLERLRSLQADQSEDNGGHNDE